ncbi:MAG: hypothetical protein U0T81_10515 [Saprospiraceae bacterium]
MYAIVFSGTYVFDDVFPSIHKNIYCDNVGIVTVLSPALGAPIDPHFPGKAFSLIEHQQKQQAIAEKIV